MNLSREIFSNASSSSLGVSLIYVRPPAPVLLRCVGVRDEAAVEEGGQDTADYGREDVEQGRVPVLPGHDDRTEGAGRVGGASRRHPPNEYCGGQREPDRYRGHRVCNPL